MHPNLAAAGARWVPDLAQPCLTACAGTSPSPSHARTRIFSGAPGETDAGGEAPLVLPTGATQIHVAQQLASHHRQCHFAHSPQFQETEDDRADYCGLDNHHRQFRWRQSYVLVRGPGSSRSRGVVGRRPIGLLRPAGRSRRSAVRDAAPTVAAASLRIRIWCTEPETVMGLQTLGSDVLDAPAAAPELSRRQRACHLQPDTGDIHRPRPTYPPPRLVRARAHTSLHLGRSARASRSLADVSNVSNSPEVESEH